MNYVVIRSGSKQYRVSENDILEVDKLPFDKDKEIVLDDILLAVSDDQVKIGNPKISDVKVKAKILEQKRGEKIRVSKFKSKVRYRRVVGFRSMLTRIQIQKIEYPNAVKAEAKKIEKPIKKSTKSSPEDPEK